MKDAQIAVLLALFTLGALGFCDDNATFAQVARGLAAMALAVIGLVLCAVSAL